MCLIRSLQALLLLFFLSVSLSSYAIDSDGDGQLDDHEAVCDSEALDSNLISLDADISGVPNCIDLDNDVAVNLMRSLISFKQDAILALVPFQPNNRPGDLAVSPIHVEL